MTDHPAPVRTHTWDGTRTLPDWLTGHHWTKGRLTIRTVDGDSHPRPGWMLIGWSDGAVTVASPRIAEREYGPDGPWARAERAEEELAARDAAESADAAAGSYALRAEEVEARLARVTALYEQWVAAGPPPLGVLLARWWDARLVELREAIHADAEQPARTTANNPPVHIGGRVNAEDCPACTGTNPPYPFICPGPDAEQSARTIPDNPATGSDEADHLTGAWTPDPPIGCLTLAGPESPPPPSDPRDQYEAAIHQAFLTTPTRIPGGQPRPGTPDSHVHGPGHMYDMTCALCRGDAKALTAAVLDVRDQALETLRAKVTEVDHIINWHTTCASCARILDSAYAETVRAEKAETALRDALGCFTALTAQNGTARSYATALVPITVIDRWRAVLNEQRTQLGTTPPVPRDPCPYCESSSDRAPRTLLAEHIATIHPEVRTATREN